MKAILIRRSGGPEVLEYLDVPTPEPAAGEVLVRAHAIGVNYFDLLIRTGAELIVDANQRIDAPTVLKLRSLRDVELARRNRSEFLYPPLARMLLMLLFIAAFTSYLRMELPAVARDNAMLAMFALLTAVTMTVAPMPRARDAIEGHVAALRETGQDVPEEDASPIVLTVDLAEREPART